MSTNFDMVGEFMEVFGQDVKRKPKLPDMPTQILRMELILEETEELMEGFENQDIVEIADALTDILYVVYGMGHALGIDLDACFDHIHSSNMSKLWVDGEPIYREDGKVLKGPNYWAPDLHKILNK